MSHDPKCHDLARYFLGDLAAEQLVYELGEAIQQSVEDWIETKRDSLARQTPPKPS